MDVRGETPNQVAARLAAYEKVKAEAEKANGGPLTGKVNGEDLGELVAKCDAYAKKQLADTKAASENIAKLEKEREDERAAKKAREEKAEKEFVATLKGDRKREYLKSGMPALSLGEDITKTKEWRYYVTHELANGITGDCQIAVGFRGNKKIYEREHGEACKW
jgi:hypothetical protein